MASTICARFSWTQLRRAAVWRGFTLFVLYLGTDYAKQIEVAGTDALEPNIYAISTDPNQTAAQVERYYLDTVESVIHYLNILIAVKLSPHFTFTNLANFAHQLSMADVNGLVLFNRFYQPDIDLKALEVSPHILPSTPQDLRLPLRWIAFFYNPYPWILLQFCRLYFGMMIV